MLEGVVANLLNRFLGMYVRNFDAKQLNVGIWSGDVKLRNLQLRKEALDQLHLPLNVVEGYLGELTLSIPWSNLRGKPVKIQIEDIFLLAAPREDADYDPAEQERRDHTLKMEKLDSAEMLKERNTEGMSQEEQKKSQSFTSTFITAVVDNVQVSVKNIHIRYEDSISDPGHPFALGFTLEGFDAVSTTNEWQPTFIQSSSDTTHKLASLKSLAVYWDTDAKLLGTGKGSQEGLDHDEFMEKFRAMVNSPEEAEHQYILKPVTGRAGLELDKTGKSDRPKIKAKLLFDELGFVLDDDQYRDALMLVDLFHYFIRHQEYKKFQPKSSPSEDPQAWLRFAGQAVLDKIHERNRQWSWDYFKERRDDRLRYIELFKKKKKEEKLTPEETTDIDRLEHKLSYEDLRFWRSLARNQLRKENVGVTKQPKKQTWGQWVWGSSQHEDAADDSQMSEEQRKELYSAINFDEKQSLADDIDRPKEYVKMQFDLSLRTGSFTLKRDPHGKSTNVLRLLFDNFKTEFAKRTDSLLLNVALDGMRLYDGTIPNSLFPQIIKIKDAPEIPDDQRIQELDDAFGDGEDKPKEQSDDENEKGDDEKLKDDAAAPSSDDPFFQMEFENNPLDGSADTALKLKLKAMEIIYNPVFVSEVVKFFKPPERHMESIGALMETAGATVEGIRQQTRAGLEFALEEHKTINAQLDLYAPLIIIPDSVTEKCSICLIIDAGHAKVSSELVDKETMKDVKTRQSQQLSDKEFKQLESLMYDKFKLRLESTQVLIGSSIEEAKSRLEGENAQKDLHIVDRINMDFLIEICIIPKGTELTKFRISGNLPVLHASFSDSKYKKLMKLIDVAIPKFDDDEDEPRRPKLSSPDQERGKETDPFDDRRKSYQLTSKKDLVLEDDSDHDDQIPQLDGSKRAKTESETPVHQRNFELKFTVDKLQGSLYKSDPDGKKPDTLLVELIAEHFGFDFTLRPYDMSAEVKLQSLIVEDHIEENPVPEFKNLIYSEGADSSKAGDLLRFKFMKINKDSPEFQSKYRGIAMNIDTTVSTINLVVTRRTLLTLLDFILLTFTNPNSDEDTSKDKAIQSKDSKSKPVQQQDANADKININAKLKGVAVVLNNDGIRLATLSLKTASVVVFLDGGKMKIAAHLGDLDLIDDVNQGVPETSPLRQLITIQGDELAHFTYETFDSKAKSYPGYDTSIYLRLGSLKLNFVTEPFRKLMNFGVKFGKMQAIFNAARQAAANQASQIQESASKMHLDIIIKTPIIVFPRLVVTDTPERDAVTVDLGEIYLNNKFVALDDSSDSITGNKISTGIRNTRLTSLFHFEDEKSEELQVIEKVDLDFSITYVEHKAGLRRPDLEIAANMSDINLRITPEQMKFLLELASSIPAAFAADSDDEVVEAVEDELPEETLSPARKATDELDKKSQDSKGKEVAKTDSEVWSKLDLVFKVGAIGLELIKGHENAPVGDLVKASLSKFSLNQTHLKLKMMSDNSLEAELLVQSFTIEDTRAQGTNKFRKIMSLINTDVSQQFMASLSISGGEERHLTALLDVDSPRIILALDYLFAIKAFVDRGLASEQPAEIEELEEHSETESDSPIHGDAVSQSQISSSKGEDSTASSGGMETSFRVNIVHAQIVLLANPTIKNSEAIVLGTKQILVAKQHAMTLQVDKVGMFLCRMDQFEKNRLRILDDFSIRTALDMRSQGKQSSVTSIHVEVDPLVLRLSLRDILLAMQIFNRASAISNEGSDTISSPEPKKLTPPKNTRALSSTHKAKSTAPSKGPGAKTISTQKSGSKQIDLPVRQGSAILSKEEMNIQMDGIRVVLIGDKHELPMLDWSVKKFEVTVRDWSTSMIADTRIDTFINVFNFSKSAWEPLIEPWQLGFHMAKETNPEKLSLDLYSRKSLELTLTVATIALASKSFDFLSSEQDVLSKPRGLDSPFKIRNYTGFTINVWAANEGSDDPNSAAKLEDGEDCPWRFEDPMTTRESLSQQGATGVVGVQLEGSGFESLSKIPITGEGETLYNLRPKQANVQHRLLVEISLGADNVKYITFRSPLLVENNTQIPVELGVFDPDEGHILKIEKIQPGDARPAPVGAAYKHSLIVRPDQGFGYAWSSERLFWKDLQRKPTRALTCRGESDDQSPPFFFQMNAVFDRKDPLTGVYPHMRIKLHAPVEVQNLLPFDFKYRIFDHSTKKDWTNFLRKGGVSPVHVVELQHLLMMSIDLQNDLFKQSEFTVINSSDKEQFKREKSISIKDKDGLSLKLKLHYFTIPDSGGAFKVTVFSPYVVLNRTGLDLDVRSEGSKLFGSSQGVAGHSSLIDVDEEEVKGAPFMFSFPSENRKNRARIKVGDSQWSSPQSFDAIGSTYNVTLKSASQRTEMNVGVSIVEGEGKYNLTKVVTITPRFIVKNKIGEELNIREPGSSDFMTLKNGELLPLRFLRQSGSQQLCLCFPGVDNQWSAPFDIANVGSVHVKLAKARERQKLVRIDVLMEQATLFLHISIETKHWPFSMRNESNVEFLFWQTNPHVNDDDEEIRGTGWKPVRYRLPPRSVMPYAWDFPAARKKEIILSAGRVERAVKLAEIGTPPPMKLPAVENRRGAIIELSIAAEGPTQTLKIANFKPQHSLYRQKTMAASQSSMSGFEVKDQDTEVTLSAKLAFAGIGVSLVNRQLRELVYLTLRDIELKYSDSHLYQTVKATIKWIQIDNQLYGGIFPIILYPSVVPKTGKELEAHPILHSVITRVKDDSYGVLYIKYFTILLQQLTVEIDEDFIFALLDFVKVPGASWSEPSEDKLCDDNLDIPEPSQEEQGQDMYFELLHIQPMQFDISFVRTERINAEDTMASSRNPLMFMVNVLTMSVGNVNDAPIKYNALMLENARVSLNSLYDRVKTHYIQESIRQVHVVIGSADFLGNPVGLFNNLASGIQDVFYEPYQGLVTERPEDLGLGIVKGAGSFVKKSIFGFSDSMAKFTGSVSKGLAAATMDKEFQDKRRMSRNRNRPKHVLYGITSGGNAFSSSLASGIGGLARHPLEGAEKEGVAGFMKGVGKGVLGMATKPAIGAFDLASSVAEGVRNTTTVFDQDGLDRVRLTRFIGIDGIVRPYAQREALGQFWLKTLDNGKYFNDDYLAHLELEGRDMMVMLTYTGILLVRTKKLHVEWDVSLKDVQTISKERTGIAISLQGGTNGPFVPVSDEQARNWLYRQIAIAVNAYNDKWNAKG
ncbi:vacuolar protein sorting-associated protein 13 [Microthyrium microscopicum]|uniref:Vacuolar protein sorting-associated protein n=1 Tax=Microthyrium microscopicum TaxID=703497 RepID=A0A6A6URN4_9PEZI|nr:vacuolar protein sorting-associated protein 13 [Microthyrium microscopicum]